MAIVRALSVLLVLLALTACALGPDYVVSEARVPYAYKEVQGWRIARPRDNLDRGEWWRVYNDPELDSLARQVDVSNQTLAAAEAAFRQAAALVLEARAAWFPTISQIYSPQRIHTGPGAGGSSKSGSFTSNKVTLETTGTWDLDVWGKVRRMVESNIDLAQASAADVANARLLAQSQLAVA